MEAPVNPGLREFVRYANQAGGALVPLIFRIPNDSLTALSVFDEMQRASEYAFFLESVETGERIGRYSLLGANPSAILSAREGVLDVRDGEGKLQSREKIVDPLESLRRFMGDYQSSRVANDAPLPPFLGGAVGYLGADCAYYFEPLGKMKKDEIGAPEMLWMIMQTAVIFDHLKSEIYIVKNCPRDFAAAAYRDGRREIAAFIGKYLNPRMRRRFSLSRFLRAAARGEKKSEIPPSNFTRAEFEKAVVRAKGHIRRGDIFQVVPSQRFYPPLYAPPLDVYRALRRLNPSPYMFYLKCGDTIACGSSPELMTACRGGVLRLRPLAGTRPRGASDAENARLAAELKADEKERAEHLMLVDLGRNDLGRVARPGSVKLAADKFFRIENYSHVMHIASEITARLAADKTAFDAVRATFPAGTLSGAPKIRALQIIRDLEPSRRGLYGGLAGYFGFDGDCDNCILIRMLVVRGKRAFVQAGGGLVADSSPAAEYQETINKARAVLRAIDLAHAACDAGRGKK
jgi:anthranilate synthase component 1